MENYQMSRRALLLAGLALLVAAAPVAAADSVSMTANAGVLPASIADGSLSAVTYSTSGQESSGTLTLTATDVTGTAQGRNATVQSGSFAYSGSYGGAAIPASAFSIGAPATPTAELGQAVDPTDGPLAGTGGSLDQARRVIYANAGFGEGTYSKDLPVTLAVPASARPGTYTATLTVTTASGPGS